MLSKPDKTHKRNLKQASRSHAEAGSLLPVFVDRNGRIRILDGQCRGWASQQLGLKSIPVSARKANRD